MKYKNFEDLLLDVGLDIYDFSNITNIPLPTIKGWSAKRTNKVPVWVKSYLELYKENKEKKLIIKYLEEKIDEKN